MGFFVSIELGAYSIKTHYYNFIIKILLTNMSLSISSFYFPFIRARKSIIFSQILHHFNKKRT